MENGVKLFLKTFSCACRYMYIILVFNHFSYSVAHFWKFIVCNEHVHLQSCSQGNKYNVELGFMLVPIKCLSLLIWGFSHSWPKYIVNVIVIGTCEETEIWYQEPSYACKCDLFLSVGHFHIIKCNRFLIHIFNWIVNSWWLGSK